MNQSGAPAGRASPSAAWTGAELLVWGGFSGELESDGTLYAPQSDRWRPISNDAAPSPRAYAATVWTGTHLFVWGGIDNDDFLADGGLYDVASDRWSGLPALGAPSARAVGAAVWTGEEVLVWGGATASGTVATGARYDPASDTWSPMATEGAPEARNIPAAVWSGSELIVWGGYSAGAPLGTGGRYDPSSDTWRPLSSEGAPSARTAIAASGVWTGSALFVWGGHNGSFGDGVAYADGALYDPESDTWTPVASDCAPEARAGHTAVWAGDRVLVWGGQVGNLPFDQRLASGYAYDPARDRWTELAAAPLAPRDEHVMVWTGAEALVWGGFSGAPDGVNGVEYGDGARFAP